ncbi:MAG: MgtC/SapB family protein [Candidatus Methanoperedens sp.]|nr:MgtC/SapB family protein [Candidatus Methanoperedens sp.]
MEKSIILLKLTLTFALALIFGYERQRSHKPIGFGTFIFVSVGSCGLAITATLLNENPLPLLGSVVTGIGFLGAGALIKTNEKTFGFTTAASVWLFAIFGIIVGVGEYFIGIIIYLLTWIIIYFDKVFEKKGMGYYQKRLIINTNKIVEKSEIKKIFLEGTLRHKFIGIDVDKKNNKVAITYLIEGTSKDIYKITKKLYEMEWLDSCKFE